MLSGGSSVGDKHHWETIYKKISKTPLADRGHKGPQKEKIKEAALGINKKIKKISGVNENIFKWSGGGYLVRNF